MISPGCDPEIKRLKVNAPNERFFMDGLSIHRYMERRHQGSHAAPVIQL